MALDDKGFVYVSDTLNSRMQKFDPDGKFVTSFGQLGTNWGEFDKPKGVAVDTFGNLYAVDSGWSNVQIFNPKGQILLFFGGRGPVPGMLKNPLAIAIDKNNKIYVGDYLNHRIEVYELVNTTAADSFLTPPPNPKPEEIGAARTPEAEHSTCALRPAAAAAGLRRWRGRIGIDRRRGARRACTTANPVATFFFDGLPAPGEEQAAQDVVKKPRRLPYVKPPPPVTFVEVPELPPAIDWKGKFAELPRNDAGDVEWTKALDDEADHAEAGDRRRCEGRGSDRHGRRDRHVGTARVQGDVSAQGPHASGWGAPRAIPGSSRWRRARPR